MSSTIIANHPALNAEVTTPPLVVQTVSIPPPKPIPEQGVLIKAIATGKSVVKVAGVEVRELHLATDSSDSSGDTSGEFVAKGKIDLFGNKDITAEFDIWQGPPPLGVTIGSAKPSVQRAVVNGTVTLSQLIPSLNQTSLGTDLTFQNVSIYHQNYLFDPTKGLGYELDADLVIDSSLGSLSSILSNVLGINDHTVHIRADFGPDQSWNAAPNVKTLTIEGSFVGKTYAAASGIQFTTIGVRLVLSHSSGTPTKYDVGIFGTLNLTLPGGGALPTELDYTLTDAAGTVQFTASLPSGATWSNAMGVQGIVLNPARFSASLPLKDPWKGLTLDISATLQYQTTTVDFTGSYSPGGVSSVEANIQGFDLASLEQLYESIHHEKLKAPRVDVTMDSVDITISSDKGFSAKLTNVKIAGYGPGNAVLSISSTGSVIHADLGTVQFGEVEVKSAYVQLDLQPASSSTSSDATIYGDVTFKSLETSVAVHLYPSAPDVVPKRTEWTVYAALTASDNELALSKIEPRLKGTPFDLALKSVVFIAASQDDPDIGTVVSGAYQAKEGVQVFATIDEIPGLNSLAKTNVTGLVLDAAWSQSAGFSLNVILPVARNLSFGKGITTTPITLSLDLTPSPIDKAKFIPYLQISAGLYIPVAHSPAPLLFEMILTAGEADATIAAELKGNWVDPFGISDEVVVGPDLLLQADIDYVTGPSGILFKGGLAIGKTTASVIVSVNEDPLKEMLYTEIDNLNFTDVVSFAEKLLHLNFPPPPSDFLVFETVKVYICPAPLTIQGVTYPSGFSFKSDMIIFGKHLDVECDTSDTLLKINGAVDDFQIGPLKVSGLDGAKQAVVQVEVGKDIQHLLVDGSVTLYAETTALHLLVDTQPTPEVSFKLEYGFTKLLTFEVAATLIGALNFKDLSKADFTFSADLEQHLLDYIHDELHDRLSKAKLVAEQGIDAAKQKVAAEQTALDDKIAQAKVHLQATKVKWEAYQKSVTEANQKIINDYNAKIQSLQDAVARAKKAFDGALQKAQNDLTNAQHDRQVKMRDARDALAKAKNNAASAISGAQGQVAAAQARMNRDFGSAEGNIESAKNKVDSLQHQIDDVNHQISSAHGFGKLKIPGLEVEKGTLLGALKVAQGVLDAAQAILRSANYVAEKTALDAAQKSLDLAKAAAPGAIADSQRALAGVDQLTQAAVNKASDTLRAAQNGPEKIVFDGAQATLAAYKRANDALFAAANKAIVDLIKSADYVAFQTATTALALAQSTTQTLNAAQDALTAAEKGSADVLDAGNAILKAGVEAFNITSIHLSGSLGKSVGGAGFDADVKGVVLGKSFSAGVELNPSKVEDFFKSLLQELEKDIKKKLHI